MKTCKWHLCRTEFTPTHNRQEFCKPACQSARAEWKRLRGAPIVDALIEDDFRALVNLRKQLRKETGHDATA